MPTVFRLDQVLADLKVSQSELSRQSGVSIVTINAMCRNRTAGVTLAVLDKLAAALRVEPGELIVREKPKRR